MAEKPVVSLNYQQGCGDCGERRVILPDPLPETGDDFDWDVRDYDGFRLFMLEELSARFPERHSWTPADLEVVLVETLSVVLDQLSDMNDRIQAESYLETAKRPATVRRLLNMIGYDPLLYADPKLLAEFRDSSKINILDRENNALEKMWRNYPHLMEEAKVLGPRSIHQQQRIVTLQDYKGQLLAHPLVADVDAYTKWSGAWNSHHVVVRLVGNLLLDDKLSPHIVTIDEFDKAQAYLLFEAKMSDYYQYQGISDLPQIEGNTTRFILQQIIKRQRMAGQEVFLEDAQLIGIVLSLSIQIEGDFYRTEISDVVSEALIDSVDGFFAAGKKHFGEDIVASDIIECLTALDGVGSVCINRLKRVGSLYADHSGDGRIVLKGYEIAVLENTTSKPERGRLSMVLHGGKAG